MPPEANDVPGLMDEMVRWVKWAKKGHIPVPIIAALLHYQFVTIHPYYDGNGRTARLLVTFILQRDGYGLNGFFSMEEAHHNYYHGRATVNLSSWVEYFVTSLAHVFNKVSDEAKEFAQLESPKEPKELRQLDRRARVVLALFSQDDQISAREVAIALGLSDRMVRLLLKQWVEDGWLVMGNTSNRARNYELSAIYRKFIGNK